MVVYHWDQGFGLFYLGFYAPLALILWAVFVTPFVQLFLGPPKLKIGAQRVSKRFVDAPEISEKEYEAKVRSTRHWWL